MAPGSTPAPAEFLPLLLALPAGVLAGLLAVARDGEGDPRRLAAFGPWLRSEWELRRAAFRPPPRAVVTLAPGASLASDAALAEFARRGSAVAVVSVSPGVLLRLCDRIGVAGPEGPRWIRAGMARQCRVLAYRLGGPTDAGWCREPLEGTEPEFVLADCRARGLAVAESRVEYDWRLAR